mmetsp:Transcript_14675/g.22614  ORF Transcript_14675/g.22614 Transcript_14675/m.22614 type:complete len:246 (-) Transcript_14675:686-1423(-)
MLEKSMECTCHHHHHHHPIHRCHHRPSFVLLRERERYHVCHHRLCVCVCLRYSFCFYVSFSGGYLWRGASNYHQWDNPRIDFLHSHRCSWIILVIHLFPPPYILSLKIQSSKYDLRRVRGGHLLFLSSNILPKCHQFKRSTSISKHIIYSHPTSFPILFFQTSYSSLTIFLHQRTHQKNTPHPNTLYLSLLYIHTQEHQQRLQRPPRRIRPRRRPRQTQGRRTSQENLPLRNTLCRELSRRNHQT